jgi:predicted DNA-binding protein
MQITVELPDALAERLNTYLKEHPEETVLSLIQEALEVKLIPKDGAELLKLAGIVTNAICTGG